MKQQPSLGTLAWAEITRGRLSRSERRHQILTVLGIRLERMARRLIARRPVLAQGLDPDAIVVPDSRSALDALELCQSVSSPSLANHCLRTYFWGALIAQGERVDHDAEIFFVASLLHDIGLTERFAFKHSECCCFAIEGALVANDFARDRGWSEPRRRALADAIGQHLNVRVSPDRGAEAYLLQTGAGADVIGGRMEEIDGKSKAEVLRRYPRLGFKEEIIATLKPQAERRPDSRIAFLFRAGFPRLVRAAPFSE